jgi:YVTN family beta-propeller protein
MNKHRFVAILALSLPAMAQAASVSNSTVGCKAETTAANIVVATVPVADGPSGIALTPDRRRAFVANQGSDDVSVIDTATNMVMATVPVSNRPNGVAVTREGASGDARD